MSEKLIKLNRFFGLTTNDRHIRKWGVTLHRRITTNTVSGYPNRLIRLTIPRRISGQTFRNFSSQTEVEFLRPYVYAPYSYAFGRSNQHLIYRTIGETFEERCKKDADKVKVISHEENLKKTGGEFYKDVIRIANAMHQQLGLKRGDVIGLWSCNNYDWIVIQFACAKLGVILCTINPYYRSKEMEHALRQGDIKALFMPGKGSSQEVVNRFEKIIMETLELIKKSEPVMLENVVFIDGESIPIEQVMPNLKCTSLDRLKQQTGELDSSISSLVLPDDPALIMFTSGTTGKPKGACLSHFTLINNINLASVKLAMEGNLCIPLPFFHSFAAVVGTLALAVADFTILIPFMKYNVVKLCEAMIKWESSYMIATPTLTIDLMNYIRDNNIKLPKLQGCLTGGAAVPVEIAHQFMETVPSCTDFRIGYGATETGPVATASPKSATIEERTEMVGPPLDFVEIKLIDHNTKQLVKLGETGEIHVRGHNIMLGYWKQPEKTKEVIDPTGWYNTEDLGTMNENGVLKIVGRTKDLIIVGGENVYPREIEEVLYMHPAVENVSVIGIPDKRTGEAICAWVQLHHGAKATEQELIQFCKEKITYFKVPKYILFVDMFPMTATGKVQKFVMQEMTIKKMGLDAKK